MAWFAGLLIALPIGASTGGIGGVAIAHVVVAFVLVGPLYLIALRHTGLAVGRVLTALAPAAAASMGCVVVIVIGGGLGFVGLPAVVVLGTAGALAYALSLVVHPSTRPMVLALWPRHTAHGLMDGSR